MDLCHLAESHGIQPVGLWQVSPLILLDKLQPRIKRLQTWTDERSHLLQPPLLVPGPDLARRSRLVRPIGFPVWP